MLFEGHRFATSLVGREAAKRDRTKNFYESLVRLAFSFLVLPSLNKVLLTYYLLTYLSYLGYKNHHRLCHDNDQSFTINAEQ